MFLTSSVRYVAVVGTSRLAKKNVASRLSSLIKSVSHAYPKKTGRPQSLIFFLSLPNWDPSAVVSRACRCPDAILAAAQHCCWPSPWPPEHQILPEKLLLARSPELARES